MDFVLVSKDMKSQVQANAKKADEKKAEAAKEPVDDKDYVEIEADSMDELINKVSKYAYDHSARNVLTDSEKQIGQKFDFRG